MVEQANSVVLSTGSYLPEIIVRNEDLTQFPKGALPLIERWTGVRARRRAPDGMLTSENMVQRHMQDLVLVLLD